MDDLFGQSGDREYRYATARICRNGHVREEDFRELPPEPRCPKCGAETLEACTHCREPIRGPLESVIAEGATMYERPNYCHQCGAPYPWVEARLQAIRDLVVQADMLPPAEQTQLANELPSLVADTARTDLAVSQWRRALERVPPWMRQALRDLLLSVATEAAKKGMGL